LFYLFVFIVFISKNVEREISDCLDVLAPDANSRTSRIKFSLKLDMLAILSTDVSLRLREQLAISLNIIDNVNTYLVTDVGIPAVY